MFAELKPAFARLRQEIRNDLPFFASCGFAVGLLLVWQARLKKSGGFRLSGWSDQLFADFVSANAFAFVMLGYLLLAGLSAALADLGHADARLERMVAHVEDRLAQLASAVISFIAGLMGFIFLYAFINLDAGGFRLLGAAIFFAAIMMFGFLAAALAGQRVEPFNRWWGALLCIAIALGTLWHLLIHGIR
ncbi:MAG: hypothetical protein K0R03_1750 [Moraxellaceae bacterium]|jgi:hypothetical protein|nr:hypothetical protein [Moraxellaceae bacterium]